MKVDSAYNPNDSVASTDELHSQFAPQQKSSLNGPLIGLIVMAAISIPLIGMAAMRVAGSKTPAAPAAAAAAAPAAAPQYIYWNYNFDEAQKQAVATGKPMMIDFYTDWCSWCKKLDAETFTNSQVIAQAQGYICVKINAEAQPALKDRFEAKGFPHVVFTDSQGNVKNRQRGFTNAENMFYIMETNK